MIPDHMQVYWGKIFVRPLRIVWVGPLTKNEMKDKCDVFRHKMRFTKPPKSQRISISEAERITKEGYA